MKAADTIRRAIRPDVAPVDCLLRSSLAIVIPTGLGWLIDQGSHGSPFLLYFPAVQAIAMFLGWRWGVETALGSAVAAVCFLMPPWRELSTILDHAIVVGLFLVAVGPMIFMGELLRKSVLENYERARQKRGVQQGTAAPNEKLDPNG
ncbi:K+-sensing histidine kinase KdpD [Novosphingobium chloroacetimidivorans]|uniref:K+-sensing histidine kinase KdpD n=1 Tax=Novosphingobium chloroacetimidivorans TaxID=1428314 RepID=A0A7W7KDB2_9SPHN|nr:DUF4118 domain-containing protein [Novosphingobium chloroacetimidivorans]MBB4860744.1 K+-sensing histidine kinase KdpD [Novosphingobium chloroacetimidivorans]